jgi:hypothetical protein
MKKPTTSPLPLARVLLLPEGGEFLHTLFPKFPLLLEGGVARSDGVVGLYMISTFYIDPKFKCVERGILRACLSFANPICFVTFVSI